jgi:hypothetical protein
MEKQVINLLSGSIELEDIKKKQSTAYEIKGFNNRGMSNFQLSKQIEYNDIIYYDIETVKLGVDYTKLDKAQTLDLRTNLLYSFSILIPKNKRFDKAYLNFKKDYSTNYINEEEKTVLDIQEEEEYYTIYYANDNNTSISIDTLITIFYYFRKDIHSKKENEYSKSTLKIIGFNNNKFDDLIFKHLNDTNIYKDNINKNNIIEIDLKTIKHIMTLKSYDSKDLSKNFGAFNLETLGKQVKLNKLDIADINDNTFIEKVKRNIKYNNRDNEIVYEFIKFINEDMGIYQTNVASWTRKHFYSKIFENLGVDKIRVSKYINKFKLYGGRTEAYKHYVSFEDYRIKYVDYNSLYTSSAVCLDMAIGTYETEITKDKETNKEVEKTIYNFNLKRNVINSDFDNLILKMKYYIANTDKFSYIDLAREYSSESFYIGKFKIKNLDSLFIDKANLLQFYFPFVSKIMDKSSFSYDNEIVYEIGFYEIIFLALFDFEIIELFNIKKGNDILKEEKVKIYEDRKILKKEKNKLEKLEKLKLNSGYGIFATNNVDSSLILDNKIIETLDRLSSVKENKYKKEIWSFYKQNNYIFKHINNYYDIKNIGNSYYAEKAESIYNNKKWTGNSIPIIGLNIVSNARFMMYAIYLDYIINMTEEDNINDIEIFYTDTDSLFCSNRIYLRLKEVGLVGNELGQLKDELPEARIDYIKAFAPKTYEYKYTDNNGKSYIKRVFKGTGEDIEKTIVNQSINQEYRVINRIALEPYNIQKRTLENNLFTNKFGRSEELVKKWNDFVEEDISKSK